MKTHRFVFTVFLSLLLPLVAMAARGNKESAPVTDLTDQQVLQQLGTSDIIAWERAQDLLKQGQSLIDTGTRMVERKPSTLKSASDVAKDRRDGQRMQKEGEATVAEAQKALNALRLKADRIVKNKATAAFTVHELDFEPQDYSADVVNVAIENQLTALWDLGYKRILVVDAWANLGEDTPSLPDMRSQMITTLRAKDGNRYSITPTESEEFVFVVVNGTASINFPKKRQMLSTYRTALVYAELVPSPDRQETWLSLRAVDAASLTLIDTRLLLFKNNAELDMLLKVEADDKIEKVRPVEPISLTVEDTVDFVNRVSASKAVYQFGIRYSGDDNGYRARQCAVLLKSLLSPMGVQMSDSDFFYQVITSDDQTGADDITYDAVWDLKPKEPGLPLRQTYGLKAVKVTGDNEQALPVGTMIVASASAPADDAK